jgi:hypothetical protein
MQAATTVLNEADKDSSIFFKSFVILIFGVHNTATGTSQSQESSQKPLITVALVFDLMAILIRRLLETINEPTALLEMKVFALPSLKLLCDWLVSNPKILLEQEKCDAFLSTCPDLVGIHTEVSTCELSFFF